VGRRLAWSGYADDWGISHGELLRDLETDRSAVKLGRYGHLEVLQKTGEGPVSASPDVVEIGAAEDRHQVCG
jgi:hypothetical protein